MNDLILGVPVY